MLGLFVQQGLEPVNRDIRPTTLQLQHRPLLQQRGIPGALGQTLVEPLQRGVKLALSNPSGNGQVHASDVRLVAVIQAAELLDGLLEPALARRALGQHLPKQRTVRCGSAQPIDRAVVPLRVAQESGLVVETQEHGVGVVVMRVQIDGAFGSNHRVLSVSAAIGNIRKARCVRGAATRQLGHGLDVLRSLGDRSLCGIDRRFGLVQRAPRLRSREPGRHIVVLGNRLNGSIQQPRLLQIGRERDLQQQERSIVGPGGEPRLAYVPRLAETSEVRQKPTLDNRDFGRGGHAAHGLEQGAGARRGHAQSQDIFPSELGVSCTQAGRQLDGQLRIFLHKPAQQLAEDGQIVRSTIEKLPKQSDGFSRPHQRRRCSR